MEHDGRIPYETIVAAKSGDSDAITEIVRHYEPYISHFAKRVMYDEGGIPHEVIDEEIKGLLISEYMSAIFFHYDPDRLPKGETLDG